MVDAPGLGQDYTDLDGYYQIPGSSVPIGPIVHPQAGREIKYKRDIFNINGGHIGRLEQNQTLDDLLKNKRLAAGQYYDRISDPIEGVFVDPITIVNNNVTRYGKRSWIQRIDQYSNIPTIDISNTSQNALNKNKGSSSLRLIQGTDTDYIFTVSDDNIPGFIANFYDYIDTLTVDSAVTKNVRLIPQFTIGTAYYQEGLELQNDLERYYLFPDTVKGTIRNYGEYPNAEASPYPQRVWLNSQQAYQLCVNPQINLDVETILIDSINAKVERGGLSPLGIFTIVDDSTQANIKVYYDITGSGNPQFIPTYQYINGVLYLSGGAVHMKSNYTYPQTIYSVFGHELGIHGLGMKGHGDDPIYISYGGAGSQAFDFQEAEIKAIVNHVLQYNNTSMWNFIEE